MTENDILQRPNRIPWPPILLVSAVLAAWALQASWPVAVPLDWTGRWLRFTGATIAFAGLALDLAAMFAMRQARTNVLPHRAADQLVTSGVFAYSRNPIYLGNTLLLSGLALALVWPWLLATALVAAVLVHHLAIRREERHLSARFGAAFVEYAQRVPRWFGFRHRGDPDNTHPRLIDPRKHRK